LREQQEGGPAARPLRAEKFAVTNLNWASVLLLREDGRMLAISAFFRDSNYFECCLWLAIGIGFAIGALRRAARLNCVVACAAFLLFGVSDYVEAHTGAWWRPWWLLVWKGGCLLVFLLLMAAHYRKKKGDATRLSWSKSSVAPTNAAAIPGTAPRSTSTLSR
jgi:hypothetical protein